MKILGSWEEESDAMMRIKRSRGLYSTEKGRLKCTRLSKWWKARIVEECMGSGLMFNYQGKVWWKKDVRRKQK